MPLFGNRHFGLTMPGLPTGGPMGAGQIVYNDEMVSGELGQIGTQFDGLSHIGTRVDGEDIFWPPTTSSPSQSLDGGQQRLCG